MKWNQEVCWVLQQTLGTRNQQKKVTEQQFERNGAMLRNLTFQPLRTPLEKKAKQGLD